MLDSVQSQITIMVVALVVIGVFCLLPTLAYFYMKKEREKRGL